MSEITKQSPLQGRVTLVLMSSQGQRLVHGRSLESARSSDQPPIIGLLKFAAMARVIWLGAMYDDPYADWWLLRVGLALRDSQCKLREAEAQLDETFSRMPDEVSVDLAESACPLRLPLKFSSPYAFIGAYLLGDYDHYVRRVLTARHIGALSRDLAERGIALGGRHVRRAYVSAAGYCCLGVTRDDVRGSTARGRAARARMGEVPEAVLDGSERPEHVPLRRQSLDGGDAVLPKVAEGTPMPGYVEQPAVAPSEGVSG